VSTYAGQMDARPHTSSQTAATPFGSPTTARKAHAEVPGDIVGVRDIYLLIILNSLNSFIHHYRIIQRAFAEGTRCLSQSPDDRLPRGSKGKSSANSTSASSVYDGSTYTSGYGYSLGSRSSGSSTFGAFDGEDGFVYFTHPVSSSYPSTSLRCTWTHFWLHLNSSAPRIPLRDSGTY
jgi:hypothetical protein